MYHIGITQGRTRYLTFKEAAVLVYPVANASAHQPGTMDQYASQPPKPGPVATPYSTDHQSDIVHELVKTPNTISNRVFAPHVPQLNDPKAHLDRQATHATATLASIFTKAAA